MRARKDKSSLDVYLAHAAYYGLFLRVVEGLDTDEAALLVMDAYPRARPILERLTRPPAVDPLAGVRQPIPVETEGVD